jgi:anti-sigma B factor antagonist
MNLPTEIFGDVLVVHAPEELNEEQSNKFQKFVLAQERVKVIVDLDSVESFDSAGLSSLLNVQENLQGSHGDLKLIASNNVNRKILEITRLDQQLEVFDSVIDAVKSYV